MAALEKGTCLISALQARIEELENDDCKRARFLGNVDLDSLEQRILRLEQPVGTPSSDGFSMVPDAKLGEFSGR